MPSLSLSYDLRYNSRTDAISAVFLISFSSENIFLLIFNLSNTEPKAMKATKNSVVKYLVRERVEEISSKLYFLFYRAQRHKDDKALKARSHIG